MPKSNKVPLREVCALLIKSYRHTWFSVLMVCGSLLIACAGLSAVLLINEGAKQSYSGDTSTQLLNAEYQIRTKSKADSNIESNPESKTESKTELSFDDYKQVKTLGLSSAVAMKSTRQALYLSDKRLMQRRVQIIGIDTLSLLNQSVLHAKDEASEGKQTSANEPRLSSMKDIARTSSLTRSQTYIHPRFAKELGVEQGDILSINERDLLPPLSFIEIDAVSDALILDIATLLSLTNTKSLEQILIINAPDAHILNRVEQNLPAHLELSKVPKPENTPQTTQSFYLNLFAMALLMFAVCLFIVLNAFNLLIYKRFAMLKVLRQLGVGRHAIMLAHALEFVVIASLMSALGVIIGSQLALLAAPTVRNIVEGLYRVELGFADSPWLILYLKVLGISLAGTALALLAPFKQLNQALSQTVLEQNSTRLNWLLLTCGTALAIVAFIIFTNSSTLWLLLLGAACLILSACCVLILVFAPLLRTVQMMIPRRFSLLRLSLAQALSLSQKTKIACCAFFIAVTSNLGMNLMVDSFRASTQNWLEQRLASDYYLYSDDEEANRQLPVMAEAFNIDIVPRYEQNIRFNQRPVQLYSYPLEAKFTQAMVFESARDDVWERFAKGDAVLVNQQFAIRNTLSLNDSIDIPHPNGRQQLQVKIIGIIYDYGNPSGQILLPISQFETTQTSASIFALDAPEQAIEAFSRALKEINIDADKQLFNSDRLLKGSMDIFDRTFVITDGLNVVTLLVAAISLACTIVILLDQSRPQSMLLRALGMSNWQNRGLLLLQYLLLCLVALVCATPFGILLSYILIEYINYHAFNWSYPLIINGYDVAILYALCITVVFAVISLPIIYTTKQSLAQELKCLD